MRKSKKTSSSSFDFAATLDAAVEKHFVEDNVKCTTEWDILEGILVTQCRRKNGKRLRVITGMRVTAYIAGFSAGAESAGGGK